MRILARCRKFLPQYRTEIFNAKIDSFSCFVVPRRGMTVLDKEGRTVMILSFIRLLLNFFNSEVSLGEDASLQGGKRRGIFRFEIRKRERKGVQKRRCGK